MPLVVSNAKLFQCNEMKNTRTLEIKLNEQMQLRVKIATELLQGGMAQEAVAQLEYVYAEIKKKKVPVKESYFRNLRDLLGIAYLRVGGEKSGVPPHDWVFPMGPGEATSLPAGPRKAIELYESNLKGAPDELATRWLLNIAYMTLGEYPDKVPAAWRIPPTAFASEYAIGRFVDIAAAAGVDAVGHAGGSVVDDFDGDGLLDIVASSRGLTDPLRFFRNEGDGTFDEWTERAGLRGQLGGLNLAHADYDNDGDADLFQGNDAATIFTRTHVQQASGFKWVTQAYHRERNSLLNKFSGDSNTNIP